MRDSQIYLIYVWQSIFANAFPHHIECSWIWKLVRWRHIVIGKLSKIIKFVERLGCVNVKHLDELYEDAVRAKLAKILSNDHPVYNCFQLLLSGVRMNVPGSRTNRLRDAFVAKAIKFYNN